MTKKTNKILFTLITYLYAQRAIRRQYSHESIRIVRDRKFKDVIKFSYHNVKYYKELIDNADLSLNEINNVDDIVKFPITNKHDLRSRHWDFLPQHLPECRVARTSGSTGVPVCIFSDNVSRLHNSAATIRSRKAMGLPLIGRPILTLLKKETDPIKKPSHWTFLQGIHKTYYINPYVDTQENIFHVNSTLRNLKLPAILAITPAIKTFANKIKDGVFDAIKPTCISSIGETLTEQTRDLIEKVFDTNITDVYACNEAGEIAWQCRQSKGYHINTDNVILEILKDGKPVAPGETGEVVITNLNRYAMPIIRYSNGDLAKFSSEVCKCGSKLPLLDKILGRSGQDMRFPDGKTVPWNVLKSAMNHNQIRKFQIVQNSDASVSVNYIPENTADSIELEKILNQRFRKLLPQSIPISYEHVNNISQSSSGKSMLVISNYNFKNDKPG